MLNGSPVQRADVRRLVAWCDQTLYGAVVQPLLNERMIKRLVHRASPDGNALREAMKASNALIDYCDYLLDHRKWLGGPTLSLADLAAAAQISVADYLGGIDWRVHEQTRNWYMGMKSRASFRALLTERMGVITPPPEYDKIDF